MSTEDKKKNDVANSDSSATPARSLGGRFSEATHPVLHRINRSIERDIRLWRQDIAVSRAHARMLARIDLLSEEELVSILEGLDRVAEELRDGVFGVQPQDEDIHMAIERRLTELVGEPGRKLHTGRSRNDQVMTDILLWLRQNLSFLRDSVSEFGRLLLSRARDGLTVPMPAFTHNQPAQVASVAHWLVGHASAAERNLRRIEDLTARLDECPLGSGAVAGTSLPIDRQGTAGELGFGSPTLSALQATGGRADLIDAVALLGLIATDLSRLGEELVLFSSPAYGFVQLPDRLTTGSSLLPHKRNPDGAEILRGGGRIVASEYSAISTVVGGLVLGYAKDLQHDKEVLFRAWDRVQELLELAIVHIEAMSWDARKMELACGPELAALWLADRLVEEGMAFREAHHLVGKAAAHPSRILHEGLRASGGPDHLVAALKSLTPGALLESLVSFGSAGPGPMQVAIDELEDRIVKLVEP